MKLRNIAEFCPPGTQIKAPGGLSFDPAGITGVVSQGGRDGWIRLLFENQRDVIITFHSNSDGGPPNIYETARAIELAANQVPPKVPSIDDSDLKVELTQGA